MVRVVEVAALGSDEDVTTRKAQESIAAATFSEVEGHGSLRVGPGPGRDAEAKGRREWTNDVDEWVQVDRFEKPKSDITRVDDVDVGDLVLPEKG